MFKIGEIFYKRLRYFKILEFKNNRFKNILSILKHEYAFQNIVLILYVP